LDPACNNQDNHVLSKDADHYLIVDTNVVLHQPDFLEHPTILDVVILSTVYKEVQHKNSSIFLRLKNLLKNSQKRFYYFSNEFHKVPSSCKLSTTSTHVCHYHTHPTEVRSNDELCLQDTYVVAAKGESPNDRNDRAIRVAAQWYHDRIKGKQIILLTGDVANRDKAIQMGLHAMSMEQYSESKVTDETVRDLVVSWCEPRTCSYYLLLYACFQAMHSQTLNGCFRGGGDRPDSASGGKRRKLYKEHLDYMHPQVQAGIRDGRYFKGKIRMNNYNPTEGWIDQHPVDGKVCFELRWQGTLASAHVLGAAHVSYMWRPLLGLRIARRFFLADNGCLFGEN
jgi:exosome complex exonuclease DIS3/RRP44